MKKYQNAKKILKMMVININITYNLVFTLKNKEKIKSTDNLTIPSSTTTNTKVEKVEDPVTIPVDESNFILPKNSNEKLETWEKELEKEKAKEKDVEKGVENFDIVKIVQEIVNKVIFNIIIN